MWAPRRLLSFALSSLAFRLILPAHAADPAEVTIRNGIYWPPSATLSAQSNLVQSAVIVYDAKGKPAGGFGAVDFALLDNGKPQPITVFSELRNQAAKANTAGDKSVTPASGSFRRRASPERR